MHIYVGHVKRDPERGTGIAAAIPEHDRHHQDLHSQLRQGKPKPSDFVRFDF